MAYAPQAVSADLLNPGLGPVSLSLLRLAGPSLLENRPLYTEPGDVFHHPSNDMDPFRYTPLLTLKNPSPHVFVGETNRALLTLHNTSHPLRALKNVSVKIEQQQVKSDPTAATPVRTLLDTSGSALAELPVQGIFSIPLQFTFNQSQAHRISVQVSYSEASVDPPGEGPALVHAASASPAGLPPDFSIPSLSAPLGSRSGVSAQSAQVYRRPFQYTAILPVNLNRVTLPVALNSLWLGMEFINTTGSSTVRLTSLQLTPADGGWEPARITPRPLRSFGVHLWQHVRTVHLSAVGRCHTAAVTAVAAATAATSAGDLDVTAAEKRGDECIHFFDCDVSKAELFERPTVRYGAAFLPGEPTFAPNQVRKMLFRVPHVAAIARQLLAAATEEAPVERFPVGKVSLRWLSSAGVPCLVETSSISVPKRQLSLSGSAFEVELTVVGTAGCGTVCNPARVGQSITLHGVASAMLENSSAKLMLEFTGDVSTVGYVLCGVSPKCLGTVGPEPLSFSFEIVPLFAGVLTCNSQSLRFYLFQDEQSVGCQPLSFLVT